MKVIAIILLSILLILVVGFSVVNLGKFLDITKEPSPSDVIVCLGGDGGSRVKKAVELYRKGYSKTNKIILTSSLRATIKLSDGSYCRDKITYLKIMGIAPQNIIHVDNVYDTLQELQSVKDNMLKYHMKSALIVSDPPHSRRIVFLANRMVMYGSYGLEIKVVRTDAGWWNPAQYYMNRASLNFAIMEMVKLPYNYFKYFLTATK